MMQLILNIAHTYKTPKGIPQKSLKKENPTKEYLVEFVRKYLELIEKVTNCLKIDFMTQFLYQNCIKAKLIKALIQNLIALQNTHEKVKGIKYEKVKPNPI